MRRVPGPGRRPRRGRLVIGAVLLALGAALLPALATSPAAADTAPPAGTLPTVSSDVLPTVQINGVVWAQVTVGNTVYAVGSFSSARPAGSPLGQNETPRANILAYDIRTGNLVTTFTHTLNAQALAIAASPNGSRIYVGGSFSQVDGQNYYRLVAFDTTTGALVTTFRPTLDASVAALAVSATTVYFGGAFGSVNGVARNRLAAVTTATGATTTWAPTMGSPTTSAPGVNAMVISPDGSRVIVGGRFNALNGIAATGMGSLDAVSGATLPWAANRTIMDGVTAKGGILTLATDGTSIYGGGYAYDYQDNFEGTFAADPTTGNLVWVNDCHGDTYSVAPVNGLLYVTGHPHDCSATGNFGNTYPPGSTVELYWNGMAWSTAASPTTVNTGPDSYGWNYAGLPTSTLEHWFPQFTVGSYGGVQQATWSVTGNSSYVAMGGEFPTVNGVAQQGLVRFAVSSIAPNRDGPIKPGAPVLTTGTRGGVATATLAMTAAWDRDNATLGYALVRDGQTATPVATTTAASSFWQTPTITLTDPDAPPGKHTYRIDVSDPFGNVTSSAVVVTTQTDLALGQPATQVSTFFDASASRAVDGNTDGVFWHNSVTSTNSSVSPWWQVDLGASHAISTVNVFNRTDCCSDRLTDYWVFTSPTPFTTSLSPTAQAAVPGVSSRHLTAQAGSPTSIGLGSTGRYVMVQLTGTNTLSLAEVQVLGT